ncbi:hypothetical protein [Mycobacterium sp.]|nr:hypothetical protein [Mycobacterium sp.]
MDDIDNPRVGSALVAPPGRTESETVATLGQIFRNGFTFVDLTLSGFPG